jgi:hypothetical protein
MSAVEPKKKRRRRPFLQWILILGFLLAGVYGWLRFQQSLILWDTLILIEVWPGPVYLAISGAVWAMITTAIGFGMLLRQFWAWHAARYAVVFLAAWFWVDRLALTQSEAARTNLPFMALLTVLVVVFTFGVTKYALRDQGKIL